MIDPIKSNAASAASQPNGSAQPISQGLINQLLMTSLLGHLDDKDLNTLIQKLKPLESQVPGLGDLLKQLQNPSSKPQEVLTKITAAVAQSFVQSDPHMTQSEKNAALESIKEDLSTEPPNQDDQKWPSELVGWSAQLISHIALNVPGIISDSAKWGLEHLMKYEPLDTDSNFSSMIQVWSNNVATCIATNMPGVLSDEERSELNGAVDNVPPDLDHKKWPSQIAAWSAEIHEKIEDAFFNN